MRDQIIAILEEILPNEDVRDAKSLADDGIIDSLVVVDIVTEIALAFDVEIPFEELVNENFNSVDSIVELVKRLAHA